MRFKASVPKDTLALLLQVTQALRRVELASSSCAGRRCVLRLSREGMSFGLVCAADDARAWADLDPRLFERYMVESRARGEVLLHVSLKQLVRALQKHSGDAIALRLAKNARAAPQLRLASQKRSVVLRTDVPVKVMRAAEAGAYAPPARVRVDAGKLAAALGLEKLDPLALSCEKASGALRVVATLRDALGLVVVYVPALVDDDADDAADGADGDDGPGEE